MEDGAAIPIEERDATELTTISGRGLDGVVTTVRIIPTSSPAANPGVRRDAVPAVERLHHRAGSLRGDGRRACRVVSRAGTGSHAVGVDLLRPAPVEPEPALRFGANPSFEPVVDELGQGGDVGDPVTGARHVNGCLVRDAEPTGRDPLRVGRQGPGSPF